MEDILFEVDFNTSRPDIKYNNDGYYVAKRPYYPIGSINLDEDVRVNRVTGVHAFLPNLPPPEFILRKMEKNLPPEEGDNNRWTKYYGEYETFFDIATEDIDKELKEYLKENGEYHHVYTLFHIELDKFKHHTRYLIQWIDDYTCGIKREWKHKPSKTTIKINHYWVVRETNGNLYSEWHRDDIERKQQILDTDSWEDSMRFSDCDFDSGLSDKSQLNDVSNDSSFYYVSSN